MLGWFRRVLGDISTWWRVRRRHTRFEGCVVIGPTEDPSVNLRGRKLILVGDEHKTKWLQFTCPCRCGAVLSLNLMSSYHPHWSIERHPNDSLSVYPSVDATTCGSHFWIRRGMIEWVQPMRLHNSESNRG